MLSRETKKSYATHPPEVAFFTLVTLCIILCDEPQTPLLSAREDEIASTIRRMEEDRRRIALEIERVQQQMLRETIPVYPQNNVSDWAPGHILTPSFYERQAFLANLLISSSEEEEDALFDEEAGGVGSDIFIDLYDHKLANLPVKCPCGETIDLDALISLYNTEEQKTLCCSQVIDLCAMTFDSTNLTPFGEDDLNSPILFEPMEKPLIVCSNDHTIDYASIKGWVDQKKDTCPLCRFDLKDVYVPNLHMFVQMHPDATVQEFLDIYEIRLDT